MSTATAPSADMRKRAEWMVPKDDPILETLRDRGNLSPLAISRDGRVPRADVGKQWASDRCRAMWKHGMVVMIDEGLYAISEDGLAYLDEELDASTLDEHDEGPVADE